MSAPDPHTPPSPSALPHTWPSAPARAPAFIQRVLLAILPRRWGRSMQAASESWIIRCLTCGHERSFWSAGGIRWGAASRGKRMLVRCPHCGKRRMSPIERQKS